MSVEATKPADHCLPDFTRQLVSFVLIFLAAPLLVPPHSVPKRPHQVAAEGLAGRGLGLEQVDHVQLRMMYAHTYTHAHTWVSVRS